ncbi:MAG: 3-hydroxybutyryl-CoA dehydrogenase [Acidobacteria bacterium]|nr:3-hydroxybutyryl-CoA dehydrogenase [Acidobacteriota bacterium]
MMEIKQVGVVGCGQMGSGIAQVSVVAGYPTTVCEASKDFLDRGFRTIENSLQKLQDKGKITAGQKQQAWQRLRGTVDMEDLAEKDLVIEAATEELSVKKTIFQKLDSLCRPATILASNTSSISITELMVVTGRPERFVGLHFFNPVPLMQLVEVIRTLVTDPQVFDMVVNFAASLGKTPVRAGDRSGFIVNRLLIPYLLDAIRALEEGTGSLEDIDLAMKLGCGHPMGPFTLLDFIGLDTIYHAANIMFEEYREKRFAPPPLLKRMVQAGQLGKKSGRGFYNYAPQQSK